jgi:hypothetical protein
MLILSKTNRKDDSAYHRDTGYALSYIFPKQASIVRHVKETPTLTVERRYEVIGKLMRGEFSTTDYAPHSSPWASSPPRSCKCTNRESTCTSIFCLEDTEATAAILLLVADSRGCL